MSQQVPALLENIQKSLYQKAESFRDNNTIAVDSYDEFKEVLRKKGGFILAHWDGTTETAEQIQKETKATIRVIPADGDQTSGMCMVTGNPSKQRVLFAVAY
jgi:prolyl-tRNA synthetase